MNRRGFFKMGTKAAVGATVLSGLGTSVAQAEELEVMTEISNNHGHELKMTLPMLVALLRKLQPEGQIETLSIQGESHPHSVSISYDEVLSVLLGEELVVESSNDFSHSHEVTLTLEV